MIKTMYSNACNTFYMLRYSSKSRSNLIKIKSNKQNVVKENLRKVFVLGCVNMMKSNMVLFHVLPVLAICTTTFPRTWRNIFTECP